MKIRIAIVFIVLFRHLFTDCSHLFYRGEVLFWCRGMERNRGSRVTKIMVPVRRKAWLPRLMLRGYRVGIGSSFVWFRGEGLTDCTLVLVSTFVFGSALIQKNHTQERPCARSLECCPNL